MTAATYYRTCPDCGAHLDPGESCDCRGRAAGKRQAGPVRGAPRPVAAGADDGIFFIRACHCKRCGGMLTSRAGLRYGYGSRCRKIVEDERRERVSGFQTTIPGFVWNDNRESVVT